MTSVAFHVDQLFYRVPGGIGTYVQYLLRAFADLEPAPDLTLFHSRFRRSLPPEIERIPRVELRRGLRTLYPKWNLLGSPPLPRRLRELDVVHAPSPGAVPPPGRQQRLVVTVHDLAWRRFPSAYSATWRALFSSGLRRCARRADAIIAVSESTARDLSSLAGVERARIRVIPLAASLPIGDDDPEPALRRLGISVPYLLFAGTIEPRKNLVRLVRAYRKVAAELPHALVLAGPAGWRSEQLEGELSREGPGRIVRTGRVSAGELDALYRGADAFAYPSIYEGFGFPVLDALARGTPTLTARSSSLPEVAGDAAILADPRSEDDLAAAILRILTDEPERARLAGAGVARAATFSWARTAQRTADVYQEVVSR